MDPHADNAVARFFRDLEDPAKFVCVRGVPVLKPLDIIHSVKGLDAAGHPTSAPVHVTVTAEDLPRWAESTNALEKVGSLPILVAGHRKPGIPELQQPLLLGYQRHFRVGDVRGIPMLLCDHYIRAERAEEARELPFRSIEFTPGMTEIRATALLKRDPQLDLGMIAFEGQTMADEPKGDDSATPNPPAAPDPNGMTPEEQALFAKFMANPMMAFVKQCFEAQTPMTPAQPAAPAAPVVPPATPPTEDQARMQREQQAIQFSQMNERLVALESENAALRQKEQNAVCEQMVVQLEAEGFSLDRAKEVALLVKMTPDERTGHVAYARQHYSRSRPPIDQGLLPISGALPRPGGKVVTRELSDKAVKLAGEKGISFDAALKEIMA